MNILSQNTKNHSTDQNYMTNTENFKQTTALFPFVLHIYIFICCLFSGRADKTGFGCNERLLFFTGLTTYWN
jgi:hypothetical protein